MHRRFSIRKTCLSAFSYAQSRISLSFCCSLGFLVPWFSFLTAESNLADVVCYVWRRRWGGTFLLFRRCSISILVVFPIFKLLKMMRPRQHPLAGSILNLQAPSLLLFHACIFVIFLYGCGGREILQIIS